MPPQKLPTKGRTKVAVPPPSKTTDTISGDSKTTPNPAVSLSPKPGPSRASQVRSIEVNGKVLEPNEHQNCSIDRDRDVIENRTRDEETLIGSSGLEVVDRDGVNMDVDVNSSGGDVKKKKKKKKKKTKVVKVVKKVVRVVKKRVPVRKGGEFVDSDVQNSNGGVLLPVEEQETDGCADNVVEDGGKFESLDSGQVEVEGYCSGQELVAEEVAGSGQSGSVSMEEQKIDECVDGVVEGSTKFESLASSPIMAGNDGVEEALIVEDGAKHSVSEELENWETAIVCDTGEKEDVIEKYESVSDMVVEGEVSSGHENQHREEVAVGDDGETSGGIPLSGQLEAMERRKRRKTEIFVGGLHLSAKEDDLKKAFKEVGEIVDIRLLMNFNTGKNRGFGFVRFASAADAKKALDKYPTLEICGKQCSTQPVEGNDTIFIGNIDKKWKDEDLTKLLQEIGVENIDKVSVIPDPGNIEHNRGFAFVELATIRDAQLAFGKLQKKDSLGQLKNVKVSWAEHLTEPNEEELMKVKSVYAEYLPPSWDEENVRDYFEKFGEIKSVAHSRNLHSSRRKDFAFVNFTTRKAALACIESFNNGVLGEEASKINIKVSLANPMPTSKLKTKATKPAGKETLKQKNKVTRGPVTPKARSNAVIDKKRTAVVRPNRSFELEKLLAERALMRQTQTALGTGLTSLEYSSALPGMKRPFSALGPDPHQSYPRVYNDTRFDHNLPVASTSQMQVHPGAGMTSFSYLSAQEAERAAGHSFGNNSIIFQGRADPHQRSRNLQYRY